MAVLLTTIPAGHILSIPRELRDEIYAPLLRAGSLVILRTCKQIHDEAKEGLFHHAKCRVKTGFPDGRTTSSPPLGKTLKGSMFASTLGPTWAECIDF